MAPVRPESGSDGALASGSDPGSLLMTPTRLAAVRGHPGLPHDSWYFIAATTLSLLNLVDEIPYVYRFAIDPPPPASGASGPAPGPDEQRRITRRMREALIKAATVSGVPKVSAPSVVGDQEATARRQPTMQQVGTWSYRGPHL